MKRWSFMLKIGGTVNQVGNDEDKYHPKETIDDIRGIVLESFESDLLAGVKIDYHGVDISELPSND